VIEIGSGHGGSLWAWCRVAAPDATIVSVDLPGGPFGSQDIDYARWRRFAQPGQRLQLIQGDSRDPAVVEQVKSVVPSAEFLLIDGDHTYEACMADYRTYGPLVRDGLVAFHDVTVHDDPGCGVDRVWREIRHGSSVELIDDDARGWRHWGGIGVLLR
jgi:cephalosporin hydroxylase